jgi:hypothetical protein
MFWNPLAIVMAIVMVVQLGSVVVAETDETFIEIVVDCDIDCQKSQLITDLIKGETSTYHGIAPANFLCLFGHSMAQTTALEINHRFWTNPTRCRQTRYRVDFCTRNNCNYAVLIQTSQVAIICCS